MVTNHFNNIMLKTYLILKYIEVTVNFTFRCWFNLDLDFDKKQVFVLAIKMTTTLEPLG